MTNRLKKILTSFNLNPFFKKEWDDLIFKHRNKSYGAYELRRIFQRNQLLGLVFTLCVFSVFILWVFFTYDNSKPINFEFEEMVEFKGFDANLLTVKPLIKEQKKDEPKKEESNPDDAVNKDLPPEVKEDPHEITKEVTAKIDSAEKKKDTIGGTGDKKNLAGADTGVTKDVYTEGPASPYGGLVEFQKWVQAHIVKPPAAIEAGMSGSVFVSFVIDKDGNVKNVKMQKGFGYGCDEEVVRVVSLAPKWKPLVRAGFAVESRFSVQIFIH